MKINFFNSLAKLKRETYKLLSNPVIRSAKVNFEGLKVKIPILHGLGSGHLVQRDPWMSKCLKVFLETKEGIVVDVGANIGLYLLKLKAIEPLREYVGFEPNPDCNYYTNALVKSNRFKATKLFPFALSYKNDFRNFYVFRKGDKMGSLYADTRNEQEKYVNTLMTYSGDQFFEMLAPEAICVIKVDVEGAEYEVLKGLSSTLKKYKPYVYCEVWKLPIIGSSTYDEKYNAIQALFKLLRELNYAVYGFCKDDRSTERVESIEYMDGRYLPDYILIPDSKCGKELFNCC